MKRNRKNTKRSGQNILRQGAAVAMAILLAMPVLPARAAEVGKGMEAVSIVPQMASVAMAAGAGGDAVAGSVASAMLTEDGGTNAQSVVNAEIVGGGVSPELLNDGNDADDIYVIQDTNDIMKESVSGGNAVSYGMGLGETRAAASTGTIGQPDDEGNTLTWSYDDSTQTLTVTGSGKVSGYEMSGSSLFGSMGIKKIVFRDCKVSGSMESFFGHLKVEEIDLSGMDTSNVTDMFSMFSGCYNLFRLDLSSFNTANVTNMGYMFSGCSSLTSLNLSGFDTANVTKMYGMFEGCSSLISLDLSGFDTANVKDMHQMFWECSRLEKLDMSGLDTANVTNMWRMFANCSRVESLDVSGFDTINVTSMGSMFAGCRNLSSLDVSSFDTTNVTDMGSMFWGCSSLNSLDVSGFDTTNVIDMGEMFYGCSSLTSLDVSGFDTTNVTGMRGMFCESSSLTSLDVSGFDTTNVTDMWNMFFGCDSLTSLDVSGFNIVNVTNMGGMFGGCSSLTSLDVSGFETTNVTTMEYMFGGCSSLTSLDVSGFNTVNVTDMRDMFFGCSSLTSLDVGSFETANVTTMRGMFQGCSSLVILDLNNFVTNNVIDMCFMFDFCSSLESLNLNSFVTENVTNMAYMFWGCAKIKKLDLSSLDTCNVTYGGDMFIGCNSLTMLCTPYNMKEYVELPVTYGNWHLPDGTDISFLPRNLSTSVILKRCPFITTTTETLNMPDVIKVKYVPYSYTVQTDNTDLDNQVTFSVVAGRLAEGLQMYPATGEIYGVPLEAGEFHITVQADYSNPKYPSSQAQLTLIVLENTDANIGTATDSGYEITQPVPDLNASSLSGSGTQLLVSEGEYGEFQDAVYLDGRRLQSGTEYTSEAGSTRITIQNQTLADAGAGSHTLSLEFRTQDGDLKRAAQNLVISGTGNSGNTGNGGTTGDNGSNGGTTGGNGSNSNSGTTGDNGNNSGTSTSNTGNGGDTGDDTDDGQSAVSVPSTAAVIDYIVQPGDNLWRIAQKFLGNGGYWKQIYRDNMDVISNPDRLRVGQHIKIYLAAGNGMAGVSGTVSNPSMPATGNTYAVQPGDTLWRIAGQVYGKNERWREIYEANRIILSDPKRIYPKQTLIIP